MRPATASRNDAGPGAAPPTTKPFVSLAPQANHAIRSQRVSARPMPTAMYAMAGRGAKPKRRPWKSSFTGPSMLAARRTLRLDGHSAARLPVMAAATLAEGGASHEVARRDHEPPWKRDLARTEVREENGKRAASLPLHVRTIAR